MKKIFLVLILSVTTSTLFAQFKNPGFEQKNDSIPKLAADWPVKNTDGFEAALDNTVKHTGNNSFRITGTQENPGKNMMFVQKVPVNINKLKRIAITVFVKTENVKGSVAIWSQVWDKDGKMIGFQNIQTQGVLITGTSDWKKYSLVLTVNSEAKTLYMGGYLMGNGSAWFDDFALEDVKMPDAPAPDSVINFIKEFSGIVKKNAIYAAAINWPQLETDLGELSKGVTTIDSAKVVTDYIMQRLRMAGDNHSFVQSKVGAQQYAAGNTSQQKIETKLLDHNIGYLSVPSFGSLNKEVMQEFAEELQNGIRKLDTENEIKGWVIDMRTNGGGNMHPMIAGLGPVLGDGTLGYFVRGTGNEERMTGWYYDNGKEGSGPTINVEVKDPYTLKNADTKIAVLIGPRTASSGEMTTISFIGKKNAKLFGEASGGFTTGNAGFKLSNGAMLYLATTYVADRNKKKYQGKLQPDEIVKAEAGKDAALEKAEEWVLGL